MAAERSVTQCVIVDDHVLLLELLVSAVRTMPGIMVAATGTDVLDADRIAGLDRVDLLIVDRTLPSGDGIDLVRAVQARHPNMKCIVIAGSTIDFVCPSDLLDCVVSVVDKAHASDALLSEIRKVVGSIDDRVISHPEIELRLTPRELEILIVLGEGLSNKELGNRFGISTRTIETHRKSIARKLGQSGAALIRMATLYRQARLDEDRRPASSANSPP